MIDFQTAALLVPFVVAFGGILYLWRASIALDKRYGPDPK